jgi:hypothetical protein
VEDLVQEVQGSSDVIRAVYQGRERRKNLAPVFHVNFYFLQIHHFSFKK